RKASRQNDRDAWPVFGQQAPGHRLPRAAMLSRDVSVHQDSRGKMTHTSAQVEATVNRLETLPIADREGGDEANRATITQFPVVTIPLDRTNGANLVDLLKHVPERLVDKNPDRFDKGRQLPQDEVGHDCINAAR